MAEKVDPNMLTTPFALTKTIHRDPYPAILPDNPENSQKGRIIIITGGGSGIGAAAAKVWARAGATGIVLAGRRLQRIEEVAKEIAAINSETTVLTVQTDITNEKDVENLYAQTQKKFGRSVDVLLNNAGYADDTKLIGEQSVQDWWNIFEINLKGAYTMIHHFINTQADPSNPVGTIITVSSGRAGLTTPKGSAYNLAKSAEQKLGEHLQLEYPTLRVFSTMPGIVRSEMTNDYWNQFAHDHADLTGMLALYLVQPRADYLKGGMVGVNWDVLEMEAHKEEIAEKKLLVTSWLPILPFNGGKGLGA